MSPVRPHVVVVGRRLDPAHHALRDLLTRVAQPHSWLEAGSPEADDALRARGLPADAALPIVLERDSVVVAATTSHLSEAWNMVEPPARDHYDLAIIGAGPAGLAAAVYAASDGLRTLVIERDVPGGQASHTSMIENFFGFPEGIGGAELARRAGRQAERFGAELALLQGVSGPADRGDGQFGFTIAGASVVTCDVAIAAPGMDWRKLDLDGVEEMLGRGVYYGAGRSEATQCANDDVVVIGAGNSAGQAVMNLASAGARVTMVVRGEEIAKTMSAYLVERIDSHPLIDVRVRSQVTGLHDEAGALSGVTVTDAGGSSERLRARALFICIGGQPRTGWAEGSSVHTDRAGFILTGGELLDEGERPQSWNLRRDPMTLETSVPGLFAAGDVRAGSTKRVAGAVGEGAMAVALAHRRIEELSRS